MSHVLSLIADPQKAPLEKNQVADITAALTKSGLAAGHPHWLSDNEACEIPLTQIENHTDSLAHLRESFAHWPIDINLLPADNRRKKALIADMDSTMIQQECIDELADAAGAGDAVRAVTARAMNGELAFEDALHERVATLSDQPASIIDDVIKTRISFMPGASELIATMRRENSYCALVSGGFTHFTSHVAGTLGFNEHQANELLEQNGKLTGKVKLPVLGSDAKVSALNRIAEKLNLPTADIITLGDGANDIPMLKAAGLGVAVHAKPTVKDQINVQISHGNLTGLLFLQGFSHSQFAST